MISNYFMHGSLASDREKIYQKLIFTLCNFNNILIINTFLHN